MGRKTDRPLVEQIVRFAFLVRLASLLLVVFTPTDVLRSPVGLSAVGFITLTSALGLYGTHRFTAGVVAHPILLVVDVLMAAVCASVVGVDSPVMLYTLSTAVLIGILLTPRYAALVLAILISSYALVGISGPAGASPAAELMLPLAYATVGAMGNLTRTLYEQAMREQATARRLSEDAARERERARLARDMHDSVAKSLHGIGLAAAALPMYAEQGPGQISARAKELQQAAESAARDARNILVDLRRDTDDRTLAQQLRVIADELVRDGLDVTLDVTGIGDCDHAIKRELVAIAAEAAENVRRHSGAHVVGLSLQGTPEQITVEIRDDGAGFDAGERPEGHFGLVGMTERAEAVGGRLSLTSRPGEGTSVRVVVPRAVEEAPQGRPATEPVARPAGEMGVA